MADLVLRRYEPEDARAWDQFIALARNGHFMFQRSYMDYHKDRFPDCSFVVERKGKMVSVIPGTLGKNGVWSSHAGLSFGGFLTSTGIGVTDMLECFRLLDVELQKNSVQLVRYKTMPWIYAQVPSEEDQYALFRKKAILVARRISSTLVPGKIPLQERRRRQIALAAKNQVLVSESTDINAFWSLLAACLKVRHSLEPVHSAQELQLLQSRFPEHIRLFIAQQNGTLLAATLLFVTDRVVHTQYLASNEEGRALGALDAVISHLLSQPWVQGRYLDFGISCEEGGFVLNEGLADQKEGFGGRAVVFDTYEYPL